MRQTMWTAFRWLLVKEWREMMVSRSYWAMLLVMGPLTGMSFISAMRAYGELSGLNATGTAPAGVGEAMAPLTGVFAPAFSACELAAVFLLPFVAIRIVGTDRQSGALKLELQHPLPAILRMLAKAAVGLAGWLIAMLPAGTTLVLWVVYGGSLYPPEMLTLVSGHLLNAALTIALAAAASSLTEHPSTAAILTLGVTVGTWMLNFFGAIQGGWWERAAGYTPAAMVGQFQHGLLQLDTVLVALVLFGAGLAFAAVWQRLGVAPRRRALESGGVLAIGAALVAASSFAWASWDTSESRANSFSRADEALLRKVNQPLSIEIHLAAEDPRRVELESRTLSKLRRVLRNVEISYVSATSTGMFEQASAGYGELRYRVGSRTETNRITTADGVLETIFSLAGVKLSAAEAAAAGDEVFRGHPLAARPTGAAVLFYGFWPGATALLGFWLRHRLRTYDRW